MIERPLDRSVHGGGVGSRGLRNHDALNGRWIGLENENESLVRVGR